MITFELNYTNQQYIRLPPPIKQYRLLITTARKYPLTSPLKTTKKSEYEYIVDIDTPGVYDFKFEKEFTIVVDPRLYVNKLLPLDLWPKHFKMISEVGYNMIHFAPLNTRGVSNSPYSIKDQLSLSNDLFKGEKSEAEKEAEMEKVLHEIKKLGLISTTDIVWNHTSCDSPFLAEHPECVTAPYLRSAFELDELLLKFSDNLKLENSQDLDSIMSNFAVELDKLKLYEFSILHSDQIDLFASEYKKQTVKHQSFAIKEIEKEIVEETDFKRFHKKINIQRALEIVQAITNQTDLEPNAKQFKKIFDEINLIYYQEWDSDRTIILEQIRNRAKYLRLDDHGPKLGKISKDHPLVDTYFTRIQHENPDMRMLANNGWIWNADPLVNFASKDSKAYLQRTVIAWGDCVKLRYGDKKEDSPWLWDHQLKYTLKMARLFKGFRIDNCHSTPIHVASYLLSEARKTNPDLYVYAELFTGSEEKDVLFVRKLGINSLIREAMNAWDPQELSRLVHRQGGAPVGSLNLKNEYIPLDILGHDIGSGYTELEHDFVVNVKESAPHNLFMDCTHDNETPHQKRTAIDTLPNAALVAMSNCAIGSVKGYDEILPKLLDVVQETRKYRLPKPTEGIIPAKTVLNKLHTKMARLGYSEIHVNQEHDFISVHRVHPITHEGYLLIARCAFKHQNNEKHSTIKLRNQHVKLMEEYSLEILSATQNGHVPYEHAPGDEPTKEDRLPHRTTPNLYHSLSQSELHYAAEQYCDVNGGCIFGLNTRLNAGGNITSVNVVSSETMFESLISVENSFQPGAIVLYKTWMAGTGLDEEKSGVLQKLWESLGMQNKNVGVEVMNRLGDLTGQVWFAHLKIPQNLQDAIEPLTSAEINIVMYRVGSEEFDTIKESEYEVPGFGKLSYCGLQGFVSALACVATSNDLGHPMCDNLRNGPWMMNYIISRLKKYLPMFPKLQKILDWLSYRLDLVANLPLAFKPKYFTIVVFVAYEAIKYHSLLLLNSKILKKIDLKNMDSNQKFAVQNIMTSYQLYGSVKTTSLVPNNYPLPLHHPDEKVEKWENLSSLAAGLPHFSTEYCRVWGRDVFISIRGLFLLTGNFKAARAHLIAFGSTLKHGLLPNLLDHGIFPRYNARDACWFWLSNVVEYCTESEEGLDFLNVQVARRFVPLPQYRNTDKDTNIDVQDDFIPYTDERCYKYTNTIGEICHEILERHGNGVEFREWNAGSNLDHAMRDEGFNISISTDWETGFVKGGNRWNCGTWMDKMGDYEHAGTRGVPATPRDGSPIEIIGLQKYFLNFASKLPEKHWKWKGIAVKGKWITYKEWNDKVQDHFESEFYVPLEDSEKYHLERPDLVNKRGIYKDCIATSVPYTKYQLRPNICIAMVKSPELFDPGHARICLEIIKETLLGPLGIKTLDPSDWAYRGVYDNNNQSSDPSIAHGFNYHQGPEWLWAADYIEEIQNIILEHKQFLLDTDKNPYQGLPELTNKDAVPCPPSCTTQAWSSAVFLELVNDLLE
ncbi:hypothetical protein HDV01_000877 [Terramyces sp. JEL0728]|nr:hypothetical protein HDV01_000877 [Terramyces sp. JEL0728]